MNRPASLYPPSPDPELVPDDLARPTGAYKLQAILVLLSLFVFVLVYLGLIALTGYLIYQIVTLDLRGSAAGIVFFKLGLLMLLVPLLLFLIKGLFKGRRLGKAGVEITEEEQPKLFQFLRRLTGEVGAPMPGRVFVSFEVNAAMVTPPSLLNLIIPGDRDLLIGLGLVNVLKLDEFKAVLAHEFGHFAQKSGRLGAYVYASNRLIENLVAGRDWFDDLVERWKQEELWISFPAWAVHGSTFVLRHILIGLFRVINVFDRALSRQMEFNADLVAVRVSGSDSIVHALSRLSAADECLQHAAGELKIAADHNLYSRDLFYHQKQSLEFLRQQYKDPHWGKPLPRDPEETSEVFDEDEDAPPCMWATHPANSLREDNAKRCYLRSTLDNRGPWVLFDDADALCQKVTQRFYRALLGRRKKLTFSEPEAIHRFIHEERTETTYGTKYQGMYDARFLLPGDINGLVELAGQDSWDRGMIGAVFAKLYNEDLEKWMKRYHQRREERAMLRSIAEGLFRPRSGVFEFRGEEYTAREAGKVLKRVERELEEDGEKFSSHDRKVFLAHYHMARALGRNQENRLARLYRFQMVVQGILEEVGDCRAVIDAVLAFLADKRGLNEEETEEVFGAFLEAHVAVMRRLQQARATFCPPMVHVEEGKPLRYLIFQGDIVAPPVLETITARWIQKFVAQLDEILDGCRRVHFKSLGVVLALQEQISKDWQQSPCDSHAPGSPAARKAAADAPPPTEEDEDGTYGVLE